MIRLSQKLFVIILTIGMTFLASCEKENTEIESGNIPGMGETPGDFEISEAFVLPAGIEMSAITGLSSIEITDVDLSLKKTSDRRERGCGSQVQCELTFGNANAEDCDIEIKGGTIFECLEEDGQSGMCMQTIRIHVLGHSKVQVKFYLQCLNEGRPASRTVDTYIIRGVTASKSFKDLVNALEPKKIDISEFSDNMSDYNVIQGKIQQSVWKLTNSIFGVNQADWDYIASLQNKEN
ncbi:hypothetical protein [Carboxylicivirga caseinilyticus]|uniref:hypothetical protein n=1 Tax=Carboxylicivirga caseinilyticus TaxID=3417572 RepID=UPI003D32D94E|nr:hypothetical protein [Marinilabiliaceae bacterium A049]